MLLQLVILSAALLALALFFGIIERLWPAIRGQKRFRRGLKTDVAWFFWNPFVNSPITLVSVGIPLALLALLFGYGSGRDAIEALVQRETAITRQPALLQAVELLVLFDLIGYWSHRMFHRRALLWRFHAVHHSSEELDWLSSTRVHPVNEIGQRMAQAVPLVALGFDVTLVAAYVPLFTLWAIGLHANVSWDFGPLRYVVASPRFHRWHHTTEEEGLDRNFAGLFPWLDALFGTLYLPGERQPERFGILGMRVPAGLIQQLAFPFRRRAVEAVE
jgi:sterol desaturase/sphingolipid hydroxylase (fatty acid hydroxylase superfamily)